LVAVEADDPELAPAGELPDFPLDEAGVEVDDSPEPFLDESEPPEPFDGAESPVDFSAGLLEFAAAAEDFASDRLSLR
jgi:hypothetical protein